MDEKSASERNPSTLHKAPLPERTEPFHPTQGSTTRSERNLSTLHKAPQPEANGTLPPSTPPERG
ncbi:hypothetical protein EH105704_14_00680 [Atlantibacter hermannii NBRC 105704]|uniref:Uncharacterized protein n=1 Tax=Atlantibacter hermannii NBRC 105704 TaxID=1115512 RepID=H5V5V8_ATLHE|nr:hypothetical protein EH105704_14_00680 [Atlantibacter hermannii NBRC 105704]